jgi:N-acetylglucosaminyldiphosphoundecaprenol N-acetyl-beta-D-mannosaminyltransferase
MQRFGLEWLHRLSQEPGRLWKRYLLSNAIFTAMVLRALAREKLGGSSRA